MTNMELHHTSSVILNLVLILALMVVFKIGYINSHIKAEEVHVSCITGYTMYISKFKPMMSRRELEFRSSVMANDCRAYTKTYFDTLEKGE